MFFWVKMNKKSQGHVEVILSFVIFLGFIMFAFIFLNPFANNERTFYSADSLITIKDEVSSKIGRLSVVLDNDPLANCYDIGDSGYYEEEYGKDPLEKQDINNPLKYIIYFDLAEPGNGDIQNNIIGCDENFYKLGTFTKENMIIYENVEGLKGSYETDYESLKSLLNIGKDFSFSIRTIGGDEVIALTPSNPKDIPVGVNVESKDAPVIIIKRSGEIGEYILNLKLW
jgi:hypothetical protein